MQTYKKPSKVDYRRIGELKAEISCLEIMLARRLKELNKALATKEAK
jgi:DNA-binding HxlR family transcriptional regulator